MQNILLMMPYLEGEVAVQCSGMQARRGEADMNV